MHKNMKFTAESAGTLTGNNFQGVESQDSVPEKKQLVSGQIAREGSHHPLECNAQPGDTDSSLWRYSLAIKAGIDQDK